MAGAGSYITVRHFFIGCGKKKTTIRKVKSMISTKPFEKIKPDHQLVDSISVSEEKLNLLFAALFLTSLTVFIGSNLLLLDAQVLARSAQMALPCWAMLVVFYAISRSTRSMIWGLVLTYGLMVLLVYARQAWLIPVLYGAAVVGVVYAFRYLRIERAQWITVLLMGIIAAVMILGISRGYDSTYSATFDMLNRLNAGYVHQDTLYHASISAMIKNYGVTSTGLHGLVETPYHVLSHFLYASISLLSGIGVIEVYGVANWILFAPVLTFCVVACSAMISSTPRSKIPIIWGIACCLLAIIPFLFR
jgi:hypothetical protein